MSEEEKKLIKLASSYPDSEEQKAAYKKLREIDKTWHYCVEWDDMLINSKTPEFDCCNCFK